MADRQVASDIASHDAEVAPATKQASGPGVEQLRHLLATGTRPPASKVIEILDTHRGERDAIFALLHSSLGNGYVQEVVAAMEHVRASVAHREVAAGDPSNPNGGYFVASQAEQGAKWRTADGSFTGKANKDGLDTRYQVDGHNAVHGVVGTKGEGSIAYERDGKEEGQLYGRYKSGTDWEAGARRTQELGDGSITASARHQVNANGANDGVSADYKNKDGSTTIGGTAAVQGGHPIGELHGSHKLDNGGTITAGAHHLITPKGTDDGVSADYKNKDGSTTFGGSAGVVGGAASGELHGMHKLSKDQTISGSASIAETPAGQVETISGSYKDPKTQVSGSIAHNDKTDALTGNVTAHHQLDPNVSLNGSITRAPDRTTYAASASEQVTPELQLNQSLTHVDKDHGKSQTTLNLNDRYKSANTIQGLDLSLGKGERDYMTATGSVDTRLGKNLYGGAWGSYSTEAGKQDSARLGASLTFTPTEKTALTLAGVIDQNGAFETRLQLDVFKQRIASLSDLSDHKKDALVSLFLSYSQGNHNMMDDRFRAPQQSYSSGGNDGQVMAGISIKF